MKKCVCILISALLLFCVVSFFGCGSDQIQYGKKYTLVSLWVKGEPSSDLTDEIIKELGGYIILNEDGTGKFKIEDPECGITWNENNMIDIGGETIKFTYKDNKITIKNANTKCIFELINDDISEKDKKSSENSAKETKKITETTRETTRETTIEATTKKEILSEKCDIILADGYEGKDYYELVANEKEDYSGAKQKIGVIKNNKWLVKPTNDSPFIEDDGTFVGGKVNSIEDAMNENFAKFAYIGNGCFFYEGKNSINRTYTDTIYNVNNGKYYQKEFDVNGFNHFAIFGVEIGTEYDRYFTDAHCVNKRYPTIITNWTNYSDYYEIEILNTTTMITSIANINKLESGHGTIRYVYPMSEGVFAAANDFTKPEIYFFNTNGNLLFDTSEYRLNNPRQMICFESGRCCFNIKNNANNAYTITINKKGKVVEYY